MSELLFRAHPPLSKAEQVANELAQTVQAAKKDITNGDDKRGFLSHPVGARGIPELQSGDGSMECAFDDIPEDLKDEVSRHLHAKGYGE